jgi:hypothetical protein
MTNYKLLMLYEEFNKQIVKYSNKQMINGLEINKNNKLPRYKCPNKSRISINKLLKQFV